jgi:radical SAM superfamily enzyme YgiQ (UPF0313 family)
MRVHLVNPSDLSFGTAVITPRWLYVLAAATPARFGAPHIVDETLDPFDLDTIRPGDVVGIGIHTANVLRGYELGRLARRRGAFVVFGGIHATLFPDEVRDHGDAHAVVSGDGDLVWGQVLADCETGMPNRRYEGGRVEGDTFVSARWDLLPADRYMWGSVQTVRGCPKHCSFCSVWRTDGQKPRLRQVDAVVGEIVALRRRGFRFILLADDNFYPVALSDLAAADRRADKTQLAKLTAVREERFELMAQLEQLPSDMVFYTQITMEAAEDPEFLAAMKRARIHGALVGVESVTPEGLKAVYKNFNCAGDALVTRLQAFRSHGVHVLGSFIFGLPTDTPATFDATADVAQRAGVSFAQFVMLTPFPGTLDFAKWEENAADGPTIDGVPLTRYWLIPSAKRPKVYSPHPSMQPDEIRRRTQGVWDRFYGLRAIWERSSCVKSIRSRIAFVLISKLYRQMYANTGIATDSARQARSVQRARVLARVVRRLFMAAPMPHLEEPRLRPRGLPAAVCAAFMLLGTMGAAQSRDEARTFLETSFDLSTADFTRLDAGQVVSRTLAATDRREVATLGVVRIGITPAQYVHRLADIATFKKEDEAVLQAGAFGDRPMLTDLAGLTLDDVDIRSLRKCRAGACGVQLSATAIDRFQQHVDWRRDDAPDQTNHVIRRILLDYVGDYQKRGTAASMEYADESAPLNLGREFISLADSLGTGWNPFAALRQHLLDYPATGTPGTTDRLYWSKEKVGRRTVVSITHLAVMRLHDECPAEYAVASKQIYGTHYFDASLGLTVLVPDRRTASPFTYLVYLNRSRIDLFDGVFGGVARHIVTAKARSTVADSLARLQRTLH